jgi:hypothetical protein
MSAAFEIEKALDLGAAMPRRGYFLHLSKATTEKPFVYLRLSAD